jgi:hypothetical protein
MAGHSKWANIRHRKGVQGEAGLSRIHLTCIRAAERPTMDGRAGVTRSISRCAMDGMHDSRLCGERQISEWERA